MVLRPSDSVPNLRTIRASEGRKLEDLGRSIGWIPSISYGMAISSFQSDF
jgi:hypothetical protein